MNKGCFGDIYTWVHDEDIHEKVFQFKHKDSDEFPERGRIWQIIELPNDFLIGMLSVDEGNETDDRLIDFYLLSELKFFYQDSDQADELE